MEAIGHLTGGLAHDLNNLLTIILGNIEVIEDCTKDNAFVQAASKQAIEAAESGAELIRRLLAFARQQPLQPQQQELNSLVTNLTALLARTLGEDINIILDLTPELWPVVIDPVQFQSALTNLANNARDAMPNGGRLTIMTSNVHLDGVFPVQTGEVVAGEYVQITVSDTGTGMTPDVASRAFEPFFTTKPIGKGTGLGLSMVFGFIKQSGGHITIDSTVGRGTSVRLHLPREVNPTTPASAAIDPGPTPRGREILLVVEDSTQVRLMTARHLRSLGYTVIEAESGEAALAILDDKDSRIDLLFTDIVMSGKPDGRELAGVARQQRPGLKVLLTSGYSGESSAGDLDVRLLQKPFNRVALACAVRSALDERQHD